MSSIACYEEETNSDAGAVLYKPIIVLLGAVQAASTGRQDSATPDRANQR